MAKELSKEQKEKTEEVSELTEKLLRALGYDLESDSFGNTPNRFAKYMLDFSTFGKVEPEFTTFTADTDGICIVRDLEVRSMCAHHLAPFFGKATIYYYPNGKMAGLSKFQRVLDHISKIPTEQETLTKKILEYLIDKLDPKGLAVVIECQHTCMIVRGVQTSGSTTETINTYGSLWGKELELSGKK